MKDLVDRKGTIAAYLNRNRERIFMYGDVDMMKAEVLRLLSNEEIKDNPETQRAVDIITKCKRNHFLSTLVTYMTGIKVTF